MIDSEALSQAKTLCALASYRTPTYKAADLAAGREARYRVQRYLKSGTVAIEPAMEDMTITPERGLNAKSDCRALRVLPLVLFRHGPLRG
jgi:hypothetical protein